MNAVSPSSLPRLIRRVALAVLVIIALGALLFISPRPAVHFEERPKSDDVHAAGEVWSQLRAAQTADAAARVRLDNRMINGLAVLASDATGRASFDAQVSHGELVAKTSISLPAGLWVNVAAETKGEHTGFPPIRLTVGRVSFPGVTGRWFVGVARAMLRLNGAIIPPLDEMLRYVRIDEHEVIAELALPLESGAVMGMMGASGLDNQLVSDIYCHLTAAQQADPASDLSEVVRRAFDHVNTETTPNYSRAAFVALSFFVAGDAAEAIAPLAVDLTTKCARSHGPILLHHRQDLAMHWTLSAALAAVVGEHAATSLGEWKELHDSVPTGSGFSFVDIAANRAGLQAARRALDPELTKRTIGELGRATEDGLLPKVLLTAPEGLTKMEFNDQYGRLGHEEYGRAIESVDKLLEAQNR